MIVGLERHYLRDIANHLTTPTTYETPGRLLSEKEQTISDTPDIVSLHCRSEVLLSSTGVVLTICIS